MLNNGPTFCSLNYAELWYVAWYQEEIEKRGEQLRASGQDSLLLIRTYLRRTTYSYTLQDSIRNVTEKSEVKERNETDTRTDRQTDKSNIVSYSYEMR